MAKYIKLSNGGFAEESSVGTSGGAGDAGKLPHLDGSGRLDGSLMPPGIGADTKPIQASEALVAGDFVNVWDSAGSFRVRKADASADGKRAHGFVLAAVASGATGTVYFEGANNQVSGLTAGEVYLSATSPGQVTATPPSTAGQVVQRLGVAVAANEINTEIGPPVVRA